MCDAEVLEITPALAPKLGCKANIAGFQKYLNGKEKSQGGQITSTTNQISLGPLVLNVQCLSSLGSEVGIPFPALCSSSCPSTSTGTAMW